MDCWVKAPGDIPEDDEVEAKELVTSVEEPVIAEEEEFVEACTVIPEDEDKEVAVEEVRFVGIPFKFIRSPVCEPTKKWNVN